MNNRIKILSDLSLKKAAIYQQADIMIYLIFEGFGMPILESLFVVFPSLPHKEAVLLSRAENTALTLT